MKDIDGYYVQVGITKGGYCGGSRPGIYTSIGHPENFRWMQSVIFSKTTAEEGDDAF